jgi:predicted nucleotidyltransferase
VPASRVDEVSRLLSDLAAAAQRCGEVAGMALVGSWARGTATAESDVAVVILGDVESLLERQPWAEATATAELVRTETFGVVRERRYEFPSGLTLELDLAPREWASTAPLDPGTAVVVSHGFRILVDPDGLLHALSDAAISS